MAGRWRGAGRWMQTASSLLRRTGEERPGPPDVVAIGRPALADVALEQRDARNAQQQQRHQERREHGPPAAAVGSEQEEAPPDAELAEVVRVTAVAPQSGVQHAARAAGP